MRTTITLLLLCLACVSTKAQNYQSIFGKLSTSWVFYWGNLPGSWIDSAFVQKDTLVHSISYKKVVVGSSMGYSGGLLREDTVAGIVWFRDVNMNDNSDPRDTIEKIAFRYNLSPGDTFDISSAGLGYTYPDSLKQVDSVRTIGGLKYIYFKGQYYTEPYTIIEGVGSNANIFCKHFPSLMMGQYLLCNYKDGIKTTFENRRYYGDCHPQTGNVPVIAQSSITLSPNPAADIITVCNNTSNKVVRLQLIDVTGRIVLDMKEQNITSISLQNLAPGCFFAHLYLNDQATIIRQLIVQK